MTEQEIKDLVNSVVAKRNNKKVQYNFLNKVQQAEYTPPEYPEYYPGYGMSIELSNANKVHIEKGYFPARLFAYKSPHETAEELLYIKNNYKQTTLVIGLDYINTVTRAFNDGNFQIIISPEKDEFVKADLTLKKYIETGIDTFGSLLNYMKMFFITIKAVDANGVIAIKNYFNYDIDENGDKTISSTELNQPQPLYYETCRVVAFEEEQYCLIDLTEDYYSDKNEKKPKKKDTQQRYYYELYDRNAVYNITYNVSTEIIDIEIYDQHNWDQLPVQKIKGIPRQYDGEIIWQSQFTFATDILDLVLLDESTINLSKKKCAYPTRVYTGRPCDFQFTDVEGNVCKCNEGQIYNTATQSLIGCSKCGGTGLLDRFSPLHDFVLNPDSKFADNSKQGFSYVAPDPAILKYLRDEISINEEKAKKILHLQTSNSIIKGAENLTATGMTLDEKAMTSFIKPISDQIFDMMQFIIEAIAWLRYNVSENVVTIIRPKTFDAKSEYDYINEISQAIKDGLPTVMVQEIIVRYLKSHYYTDNNIAKAFELFVKTDLLLGMTNDNIVMDLNKGIIAPFQKVIHDSGITLITKLAEEYPKKTDSLGVVTDFFSQEFTVQQKALIDAAKLVVAENKPASPVTDVMAAILNNNAIIAQ